MSLDVYLRAIRLTTVHSANITHNLNKMAGEAGIYKHLWRPDKIGITKAEQLVEPLRAGLEILKSDPERFKKFNPAHTRKGTQGRKPSGLGKPELYRLYAEDEEKLSILKEKLGIYYNKNEIVRQAVRLALETVYTELVKH